MGLVSDQFFFLKCLNVPEKNVFKEAVCQLRPQHLRNQMGNLIPELLMDQEKNLSCQEEAHPQARRCPVAGNLPPKSPPLTRWAGPQKVQGLHQEFCCLLAACALWFVLMGGRPQSS